MQKVRQSTRHKEEVIEKIEMTGLTEEMVIAGVDPTTETVAAPPVLLAKCVDLKIIIKTPPRKRKGFVIYKSTTQSEWKESGIF
jgi:hypothetical protein